MKRKDHADPIHSMTKAEIEEERQSEDVVMTHGYALSFMRWWKTLHMQC